MLVQCNHSLLSLVAGGHLATLHAGAVQPFFTVTGGMWHIDLQHHCHHCRHDIIGAITTVNSVILSTNLHHTTVLYMRFLLLQAISSIASITSNEPVWPFFHPASLGAEHAE